MLLWLENAKCGGVNVKISSDLYSLFREIDVFSITKINRKNIATFMKIRWNN
jgi:hypothetical protein